MRKFILLVSLLTILTQGCSQDDFVNEMFISQDSRKHVELELPKEIEDYGKAVATEIRTTVTNMVEKGIDYSNIPDSVNFRKRFYSDWYAANPKTNQIRSAKTNFPLQMNASEFAEKCQMLTSIQIDFINKIIKECELSTSNKDLLDRLVILKDDICLHVPQIEQDRLLYIISVLYYGMQTFSELEAEGLILKTPYNYNELQLSQAKTRSEGGSSIVPSGCRKFLATVWTIAVGEPTPAGEIVASVVTVCVAGVWLYEVITCKDDSYSDVEFLVDCSAKYADCLKNNREWSKNNSGGWGSTMCYQCYRYCEAQNVWDCPRPI